jgi:O-acetyl-ADP-ribose deacetylase (regulator of RNase III)
MIKVIKGNLIDLGKNNSFNLILHGCNCFHSMNAGIAKQIKDEFPEAYDADKLTAKGDKNKLGTISKAKAKKYNNLTIINCYSQYSTIYSNGEPPINYKALERSFKNIKKEFDISYKIGIPLIGYGLAGGDLISILNIIYNELSNYDTTIVIYEKDKNADLLLTVISDFFKLKEDIEKSNL